ncbi:hypothetical protein CVT24_008144 [Panaeolus cyanescens]|uniref:Uncharacterized protein n=1 Tax=Panaeolus cyanescens TaxID=181874 RepID=A0A409YLC3_9AGAR|nr:hypothetical protein CVT24_008144 [Panaeolus cyanescens]
MRVHRERLVNAHSNVPDPPPHERNPAQNLLESAAAHLLDSFAHPFGASSHHVSPGRSLSAPPAPINDWHLDDDQFHMMLTPEEEELARAREIAQDIERMLFEDGSESGSGDVNNGSKAAPRRLNETLFESPEWFPWPDKATCTLDIIMHLPRSVFSNKQMDLFLWLLQVNGVSHVPTVRSMKSFCEYVQSIFGIEGIPYRGGLGHRYFVNSLADILAQVGSYISRFCNIVLNKTILDITNPLVRPHLHFLPEDAGPRLSEARQADRWLHEPPPPKDFYIYEPSLITGNVLCWICEEIAGFFISLYLYLDCDCDRHENEFTSTADSAYFFGWCFVGERFEDVVKDGHPLGFHFGRMKDWLIALVRFYSDNDNARAISKDHDRYFSNTPTINNPSTSPPSNANNIILIPASLSHISTPPLTSGLPFIHLVSKTTPPAARTPHKANAIHRVISTGLKDTEMRLTGGGGVVGRGRGHGEGVAGREVEVTKILNVEVLRGKGCLGEMLSQVWCGLLGMGWEW